MTILKVILIAGASVFFVASFAACEKKGPAETAGKSVDTAMSNAGDKIEEAGVAIDDAAITTKVKAAILAEPGLRVLQVDVDTVNGVTTLKGKVDSQKNSEKAAEIAAAVSGVKNVDNQLAVN